MRLTSMSLRLSTGQTAKTVLSKIIKNQELILLQIRLLSILASLQFLHILVTRPPFVLKILLPLLIIVKFYTLTLSKMVLPTMGCLCF